jgi:hypothetical protein
MTNFWTTRISGTFNVRQGAFFLATRDGDNAGVSPRPDLAYPQASWFLLGLKPPEARHIQLRRVANCNKG